jgi:DNA-directed RNA polymerase subunit M/transcription elongation factor TFIIS
MLSIYNPERFRKNIRIKIKEQIIASCNEVVASESPSLQPGESIVENISTNLEKSIFNYSIREANRRMIIKKWENTKFTQLYTDRLRTIYLNLKNKSFITKIITSEIKPEQYTEITHYDICPQKWNDLIEQNHKKEESLLSVNIKANTDLYTCRKCKSRNIYFTETQTRSADEQSTITLLCLTCGKRWTHG